MLIIKYKNKLNESDFKPRKRMIPTSKGMMIVDEPEMIHQVSQLILNIGNQWPSIGAILRSLNIIYDYNVVDSLATDGFDLWINPAFVQSLFDAAKQGKTNGKNFNRLMTFILMHEALHIILYHTDKRVTITYAGDDLRLNVAMDAEVNYYLENAIAVRGTKIFKGVSEVIEGVVNNYKETMGKRWEHIYNYVPDWKIYKDLKARKNGKRKMSDSFNQGFIDGYKEYLKKLRSQNLIERVIL